MPNLHPGGGSSPPGARLALAMTIRNRQHCGRLPPAPQVASWCLTSDQVPAGFFVLAFGAFAGAGGGPGARSIDTKRPPVKR